MSFRALLSVSDKSGLLDFARGLVDRGVELVATGGTRDALKAASIPVRDVTELTRQKEIMGGRVKTLSTPIFAGVLFRRDVPSDVQELRESGAEPIDLVVINFYPFEAAASQNSNSGELIEWIDVGGPALVRAAAKNAKFVWAVTDPADYPRVVTADFAGDASLRESLAQKAWLRVADYDRAIAEAMGSRRSLRYGENPHQSAFVLGPTPLVSCTSQDLSYSNALDVAAGVRLARGLADSEVLRPWGAVAAVVIKHAGPCGVAVAKSSGEALRLAWEGDPVSAFGGVVVLTAPLDAGTVEFLCEGPGGRFVEVVCAPGLVGSPELTKLMAVRKKLKALNLPSGDAPLVERADLEGVALVQTRDRVEDREVIEGRLLGTSWSTAERALGVLALHCAAALKSNSIAIVREVPGRGLQLTGTGQGQPNRVEALKWLALPRARRLGDLSESVLASDGFFPFPDSIEEIAAAGIRRVVQPGGSVQDPQVEAAATRLNVGLLMTGVRHFRH